MLSQFEMDQFEYLNDELIQNKEWKTATGDVIHISKMTDQHLINTIKWLNENDHYKGEEWIEIMEQEQTKRDKQVIDMFD